MKKLLKGILGWGVIGFVMGLLLAPEKGEETRKKASTWIEKGKAKLDEWTKGGGCCGGESEDCCKDKDK